MEATPGFYYGITNENGSYIIAADTGSYTVRQVLPQEISRTITQVCPKQETDQKTRVSQKGAAAKGPSFGNRVVEKPYLSVSVSSDRRRCFPGTTTVSFANAGFATAQNSKVYLQLPEYVILKSADKPFSRQANGTYVFEVGNVAAGQRSVISIQDYVMCGDESIRGLTVCTKAWMTPANH